MNADTASQRNSRIQNLLRPDVLARLSSLELVAKSVVEGYFTGMHRSPFFGFSQEFSEYRAYNDGDDTRFIDWNVYARTDRTYICLLYTSPSPRDATLSRMPSSA